MYVREICCRGSLWTMSAWIDGLEERTVCCIVKTPAKMLFNRLLLFFSGVCARISKRNTCLGTECVS